MAKKTPPANHVPDPLPIDEMPAEPDTAASGEIPAAPQYATPAQEVAPVCLLHNRAMTVYATDKRTGLRYYRCPEPNCPSHTKRAMVSLDKLIQRAARYHPSTFDARPPE